MSKIQMTSGVFLIALAAYAYAYTLYDLVLIAGEFRPRDRGSWRLVEAYSQTHLMHIGSALIYLFIASRFVDEIHSFPRFLKIIAICATFSMWGLAWLAGIAIVAPVFPMLYMIGSWTGWLVLTSVATMALFSTLIFR
jgi:hypothetical protein